MGPTEFCYWLRGYFEIAGPQTRTLSQEQVEVISKHLALVFAEKAKDMPPISKRDVPPILDPESPESKAAVKELEKWMREQQTPKWGSPRYCADSYSDPLICTTVSCKAGWDG